VPDPYALNLRHLLALPAIARAGGLGAAGEIVHLSQPALTQGLARLETTLGVQLFVRGAHGVAPTRAGKLLVIRVERAAAQLADGARILRGGAAPGLVNRLTMSQIRALAAVATQGSFTLAARESGLAQPSVQRAARELEQTAGQPLFVRAGRTIELTPQARRLARRIRLAVAELRDGLAELAALADAGAGAVTVGALPLARARLIPRAVARFTELFPTGQVKVIDGPYVEMLSELRAGDIDLIVGAERDPPPARDIVQEPLFEDRLIVVARRGHPLGEAAAPDVAELARYPWVVPRREAPLRARWEGMFRAAGLEPPRPHAECSSTMAVRGLLLQGDWLSLLSPEQVEVERRAGLIVQIGPAAGAPSRRIALTRRRDLRPTAAQAAMADLIRELSGHGAA
jgi:DNA-binding transcriptional LysR family regulator